MKKKIAAVFTAIAIVASLAFLSTGTTGCGTLNNVITTNNVASAQTLVTSLTKDSIVILLNKQGTNARPYVVAVGAAVATVANSTNASPAALTAALQALPVQGINSADATLAIDAITTTYTLYFNQYVQQQVAQNLVATTLLTGVSNGINAALQATPAQLKFTRSLK